MDAWEEYITQLNKGVGKKSGDSTLLISCSYFRKIRWELPFVHASS